MAMIVRLSEEPKTPIVPDYPFLGIGITAGMIVLFTGPSVGTIVFQGNGCHPVGTHISTWDPTEFKICKATITLKNA